MTKPDLVLVGIPGSGKSAVAAVLDSRLTAAQALEQLMSRDPREEIA